MELGVALLALDYISPSDPVRVLGEEEIEVGTSGIVERKKFEVDAHSNLVSLSDIPVIVQNCLWRFLHPSLKKNKERTETASKIIYLDNKSNSLPEPELNTDQIVRKWISISENFAFTDDEIGAGYVTTGNTLTIPNWPPSEDRYILILSDYDKPALTFIGPSSGTINWLEIPNFLDVGGPKTYDGREWHTYETHGAQNSTLEGVELAVR